MLMAAGLGTRLRPFTEHTPKPLLPLMGVPMAQFMLDRLSSVGVNQVVVNAHHALEKAVQEIPKLDFKNGKIHLSLEQEQLLGGAGGIKQALPLLESFGGGPFFWLNGDVVADVNLELLANTHFRLRKKWGVTMTLWVLPNENACGAYREVLCDPAGEKVEKFGEIKEKRPFFAGVAVMEPQALRSVPAGKPWNLYPEVMCSEAALGKVGVCWGSGRWYDIGSPELWHSAHMELLKALETHEGVHQLWRNRIEKSNRRVGSQIWVSKDAPSIFPIQNWEAPAYWSPFKNGDVPPDFLKARSVVYGSKAAWLSYGNDFLDMNL